MLNISSRRHHPLAFPALLLGNVALAFGPWLVRLADVGPLAVGFWRLSLALPLLVILAFATGQRPVWPRKALIGAIAIAGVFYAADLASWHTGIHLTKLGNAALLGNFASFAFVAWGLWLSRRLPTPIQAAALILAAAGCAMLVGSSAELSVRNVRGDLLALAAGILYAGYLIFVERARTELKPLQVLIIVTTFSAILLLPASAAMGETILPTGWSPLLVLAFSSQVVGQGLLVYAIGTFSPLVVGLALLTQPSIAAFIGWLFYDERLSAVDWAGTVAIAVALVLVQLPKGLRGKEQEGR